MYVTTYPLGSPYFTTASTPKAYRMAMAMVSIEHEVHCFVHDYTP